ncbi:MAG TPA: hypothetical protein VHO70_04945 [Chitinispirillaceae bacterium]|nr:hypothetical protein [Chitinispirillaceae bacterium]
MHLHGIASAPGVDICSSNDYLFKAIDTIKFIPEGSYDYKLLIPDTCSLAVPSYKNEDFNEDDTVTITVKADSGLVISPNGIQKVTASGSFVRTIGKNGAGNEIFNINGILDVSYAAKDFQLKISPNGTDSIFQIHQDYFISENNPVYISKGSISFFSDFSINTLYGKKDDGHKYTVSPDQFKIIGIPSQGFDIFKTSAKTTAGIRVLLLAPDFNVEDLKSMVNTENTDVCDFKSSIYNAGFDLNGNLTNISGKIELPENMASCFGVNGMNQISKNIAAFKMKTLYLGYENNDTNEVFKVGADANIILGSIFNKIGLQGEKIGLDKLTAGYSNGNWSLREMHASAFPLPRLIGIGPKNFNRTGRHTPEGDTLYRERMRNDSSSGINYVELYTGGNGFRLDYEKYKNLKLDLQNWSLRLTDKFPVKALRGITFLLNKFEYEKDLDDESDNGRITEFDAAAEYIPPGGSLVFGDVEFIHVKVALGCDKERTDTLNSTDVNAYIAISFDSLRVGDKIFEMSGPDSSCKTELKVYFDGNFEGSGCLVWRDTIGIVPWGQEHNPDIYIDPGVDGTQVSIKIKSGEGFSARVANVFLRSKDVIEIVNRRLAVDVNELSIQFKDKKFCLKKLDVSWWIYEKLIDNAAFKMVVNKIDFGYSKDGTDKWTGNGDTTSLKNAFWIITEPQVDFKLNKGCSVNIKPSVGLVVNTEDTSEMQQRNTKFIWKVDGGFKCELGGLDFGAKFKINRDTIGFDTAFINMSKLGEHFDEGDKEKGFEKMEMGVEFYNAYWIKNGSGWHFNPQKAEVGKRDPDKFSVIPRFRTDKTFNICGLSVHGTFNFERLFSQPYPGIGFEDISVKSKKLGDNEIPLCMSLYLDGRKPFIHPVPESPKKIPISIPGIQLTPDIKLCEAHMEFGVEQLPGSDEESWYFSGDASMNLKGAVENLDVKVSFERPSPPKNSTGIRYAKVTIKLAKNCRIPIGSTPLFITGFQGAIYDGEYMPDGAKACHIPSLPPGLKVEAAIFVELEDPNLANGKVGFWVHLMKLNFGVNGGVKALKGIADAEACMALYNNGHAFHGHFKTMIHLGLMAKGQFVIDIWRDESGGNFTADASASIGLSRAALFRGRIIKIPRKDRWFLELFTKAGKFSNNNNGVTTGFRFFGRTWGLGVIGGKFKIGNVGKYKLKQAPVVMPSFRMALAKAGINGIADYTETDSVGELTYLNPGFKLEGGEVISFTAASDSGSFNWPEQVLRVVDPLSGDPDLSEEDYLPFEGNENDSEKEYFINDENMVARLWANNKNYDSIYILVPKQLKADGSYGGIEYLFSAGLKPAVIDSISAVSDDDSNTKQVTFKGKISDFQGHIRNIIRNDSTGVDTLMRQKMALKLYCSSISPRPADTSLSDNYMYNFMEIPISQFEGYDSSHTSLLDNPNVFYDSVNRTLSLNNLEWNTDNTAPGKYALRAAVEVTDFVIEDEDGNKTILPESMEYEAPVFREKPVVIPHFNDNDTIIINIVNDRPMTKPEGFTATGSESDNNWAGENEKRSIFLRWHMDDNPSVHGYEISWYPSNVVDDAIKKKLMRSTFIGKTDHYTINIPDLTENDSLYTDDCGSARGSAYIAGDTVIDSTVYIIYTDSANSDSTVKITRKNDLDEDVFDTLYYGHVVEYDTTFIPESTVTTKPNRLCPGMIDTAYYKAKSFDCIITPVYNQNQNFFDSSSGRNESILKSCINSDFADTIRNVYLGINTGSAVNLLSVKFKTGSLIDVPLNEGTIVDAQIRVSSTNTSDNASRFGEIWAKVVNDSVLDGSMPKAGSFNNYFYNK